MKRWRARWFVFGSDNVFRTIEIRQGDAAAALASADIVIEGEYHTGAQEHVYLEPQGIQAEPHPGGITLRGSMQCPYYLVEGVALLLGLPPEKVRVIPCAVGGGFGGKEDFPTLVAGHAALLAWKAQRPVRLIYGRVEDLRYTSKRHPSRVRHRTGWTRDGRLVAMQIQLDLDGGAYSTLSPLVLQRSAAHAAGPYQCDHIHITARAVATNHPPRGAFRGFRRPQALFALETHLDYCAAKLGLDPIEVRRRNLIRPGGTLATGQNVGQDAAVGEVLERALAESEFFARREAYAAFNRQAAGGDRRGAVPAPRDRVVAVHAWHRTERQRRRQRLPRKCCSAATPTARSASSPAQIEFGQGTHTILAQLAAEGLAMPVEWVVVEEPDTVVAPNSGPTVASRTAAIVGGLLISAGRRLRAEVERRVRRGPISDPHAFRSAVAELVAPGTVAGACGVSPAAGIALGRREPAGRRVSCLYVELLCRGIGSRHLDR